MGKKQKNVGKIKAAMESQLEEIMDKYRGRYMKEYDRMPTRFEERQLFEKAKKELANNIRRFGIKAACRMALIAASFGIGFGIGSKDEIKGITDGKNNIKIEGTQLDEGKDIEIKNLDERSVFIDGIKVDVETLEQISETQQEAMQKAVRKEEIQNQAEQDIEQLQTKEQVLDYAKKIYAEEYNENHEEQIDVESIRIYRERDGFLVYKDENGTCRIIENSEEAEKLGKDFRNNNSSHITINAQTVNGTSVREAVTDYNYNGEYYTLYGQDEIVPENQDNTLFEVAEIIDKAVDRYASMDNKETSEEIKNQYKKGLINAVVEYRLAEEQISTTDKEVNNQGPELG